MHRNISSAKWQPFRPGHREMKILISLCKKNRLCIYRCNIDIYMKVNILWMYVFSPILPVKQLSSTLFHKSGVPAAYVMRKDTLQTCPSQHRFPRVLAKTGRYLLQFEADKMPQYRWGICIISTVLVYGIPEWVILNDNKTIWTYDILCGKFGCSHEKVSLYLISSKTLIMLIIVHGCDDVCTTVVNILQFLFMFYHFMWKKNVHTTGTTQP